MKILSLNIENVAFYIIHQCCLLNVSSSLCVCTFNFTKILYLLSLNKVHAELLMIDLAYTSAKRCYSDLSPLSEL